MKKFGLIGQSLKHSFSKEFFNEKFQKEKISARYDNYELENLSLFKSIFFDNDLCGLNVTIPFKEKIINYLDDLDPISKKIGAVNTILPTYSNKKLWSLKGFNTDAYGFHQLIKPFLKSHHNLGLILGDGGASKAVSYVFDSLNINYNIITRKNTSDIRQKLSWNDINSYMVKHHLIIVNTTPIGMYPNSIDKIDFPYEFITKEHLIIDLIYNPSITQFLQKASSQNAQILNGYQMLIHQALKAWNIWNFSANIK